MKKWIGLALCAMLLLTAPAALGTTVYTEGYFEYQVVDGGIVICGYFGRESEVTVPSSIAGYPVSCIGSGAFSDCSQVRQINLPDTIMKIEEGAIGGAQTVVYSSNTENTVDREPLPTPTVTQKPTVPDASNSESTGIPSASEVPDNGTEIEETPEKNDATESGAAAEAVSPAPADDGGDSEQQSQPQEPTEEFGEGEKVIAKLDGTVERQPLGLDNVPQDTSGEAAEGIEAERTQEELPQKLDISPVQRQHMSSGWIWTAICAVVICSAGMAVFLVMRKRNGMH